MAISSKKAKQVEPEVAEPAAVVQCRRKRRTKAEMVAFRSVQVEDAAPSLPNIAVVQQSEDLEASDPNLRLGWVNVYRSSANGKTQYWIGGDIHESEEAAKRIIQKGGFTTIPISFRV